MSKRDSLLLLDDMVGSAKKIVAYTKGMSFEQFIENDLVVDAVIRNFEIIGEAAGRVAEDVQKAAPEIPWREAVGIRNRLVRANFDVDLGILWQTAVESAAQLQEHLEKLFMK
jgi:uncharacterized protein with HEPN domain